MNTPADMEPSGGEEHRARNADELTEALNAMSQGVCIYDHAARLILANPRYYEIMHLSPDIVRLGMTYAEVIAAKAAAGHYPGRDVGELLRERMALIAHDDQEVRFDEFPDTHRRVQANYRRTQGGGFIVTFDDVTAARAAEAKAAAAGRLSSLGEMAAGLAHELKQPLTIISLSATNGRKFLSQNKTDLVAARLDRIIEQAMRGGALIDHLRQFARGWNTEAPLDRFALSVPLQGALLLAGNALREASITVSIAMPDPAPRVLGHPIAVEQVLVNLLMNARDAIAERHADPDRRITIDCARDQQSGTATLAVEDNGGGVPPAVIARIFEPFVTTKGPDKGTGLGLAISHGLAASMGGTIAVRNVDGGARFELTLRAADDA